MNRRKKLILLAMPGNEVFTRKLADRIKAESGKTEIRSFPDGESYVRILSDVKDKNIVVVCTLHKPNKKFLPLYFLSQTLKHLGAEHVCLVAPYLAYMRQDKVFKPGESVTSAYFAEIISDCVDSLITIDPHLHRRNSLSEIYSIPCEILHAADHISDWINKNVEKPVLIGPDSESDQWVRDVADKSSAPIIVLQKVRKGDRDVSVSIPDLKKYRAHTPVLVDDIISTARTMIETIRHLRDANMNRAVCIGIHPVFAGNACQELLDSGVGKVVTCNTIPHLTNGIDISDLFTDHIKNLG
jgi:ribose-phosphate pyrophosphokinase